MKKVSMLLILVSVGGCTTLSAMLNPVSPAQVYALADGVTIAETLALNYTKLPPCPTANGLCADPNTKAKIKLYGQQAYDAVKVLEASSAAGAPAAYSAAQAALVAFRATIPGTVATK